MSGREALYIISVAARLVDMHPSTLRKYEREGFLEPSRMGGKLRLYSTEDIRRLRQIKWLVEDKGVNIAGIDMALELTDLLHEVRALVTASADSPHAPQLLAEARRRIDEMLEMVGSEPNDVVETQRPGERPSPARDYQR